MRSAEVSQARGCLRAPKLPELASLGRALNKTCPKSRQPPPAGEGQHRNFTQFLIVYGAVHSDAGSVATYVAIALAPFCLR